LLLKKDIRKGSSFRMDDHIRSPPDETQLRKELVMIEFRRQGFLLIIAPRRTPLAPKVWKGG
jgi:hypothetical protein